jgi:hypothetical protein
LLLLLSFPSIAYDVCIALHTVLSFFWSLEGVVVTLVIRFRRAGDKNTRITTHEHEVLFFLLLLSFFPFLFERRLSAFFFFLSFRLALSALLEKVLGCTHTSFGVSPCMTLACERYSRRNTSRLVC